MIKETSDALYVFFATGAMCLIPALLWTALKERRRHRNAIHAIHKRFNYEKLFRQIRKLDNEERVGFHVKLMRLLESSNANPKLSHMQRLMFEIGRDLFETAPKLRMILNDMKASNKTPKPNQPSI